MCVFDKIYVTEISIARHRFVGNKKQKKYIRKTVYRHPIWSEHHGRFIFNNLTFLLTTRSTNVE